MSATAVIDAPPEEAEQRAAPPIPARDKPTGLPLSLVVGNEPIKIALLLAAVNPLMGGVAIGGRRGTGKSVMARGLHRILPPLEVVKGSSFNIDPNKPEEVDDFLKEQLAAENKTLDQLDKDIIPTPFVQVPLNVMEDRLVGSVDVEESVKQGKPVFAPGLLARAHRGVLYVDDLNLLDPELANILLSVISDGWVQVEREGISVRYPCRPLIVATFNPEESEMREHLLDRLAVSLSVDATPLTDLERVQAVEGVLKFGNSKHNEQMLREAEEEEDELRTRIIFSREYLKRVKCTHDQIKYLCEEAVRAGVQGQRAEIFACEVARASAALDNRDSVTSDDLKLAVKLVIAPRGVFLQQPENMMQPPPPPPPPPQQDTSDEDTEEDKKEDEKDEDEKEEDQMPEIPQEFMFDAEGTPIDEELINFVTKQQKGKSGGRGLIFSQDRGRYIKPMFPKGKVRRLAVDATMRAAAPYQRPRRQRALKDDKKRFTSSGRERKVFIEEADVRVKRMARKAGALIVFVVDASGSMALNRMNAAKGAAISLLSKAYESRDKISLITFQGTDAEVLLPPTRSIAMAKRRLETMPCGGGSPLAHAINVAVKTGINAQKSGDVGKVVIVCISDGRANVGLNESVEKGRVTESEKLDKEAMKAEVLDTARALQGLPNFHLVMLDMENKFVSTGLAKEVAEAAGGRYYQVPKATERSVTDVAVGALAMAR
ncbi:unnamed protein product [Vitrella brassicaformis CCMP3155]|uniref:Mg-protoporphyrin IX chelatase n=1 Tax=Vitrella brassicaformis (strain CCMP3155) TaxID=1169540 RepID=A0A0G4EGQ7_VITBC|nr:unnamed protein product [Vitrella brassicaformis CCMP3155]|eukprot:CEL94653.1 unnamed protein product [Vitrella brassicaformis CCMP3155]